MKKTSLLITLVLAPGITYADIWDNSTSSFYNVFYFLFVLPILFWIANCVVLVFTVNHRKIRSSVFWTVAYVNILLALFSLLPVWEDLTRNEDDSQTVFTLIVLAIIPLIVSAWSIWLRNKQDDSAE